MLLLAAIIPMALVTRAVDVTLAGEPWGVAYGFPFLWRVNGVTSLSQTVAVGSLAVNYVLHLTALSCTWGILHWAGMRLGARQGGVLLAVVAVSAVVSAAMVGVSLLDVDGRMWLDETVPVPGTSRWEWGWATGYVSSKIR